jgi:hypothetical protein
LDDATPQATVWSEILDNLDDRAVFVEPGAVFSFSRYDYPLALRALERSVDEDLSSAASRWVFEPLGMENTSLDLTEGGLPVLLTTAPDLLQFGSAWIGDQPPDESPASADLPSPAHVDGTGRSYEGGLWKDEVVGQSRASLLCSAGPGADATGLQIFPSAGVVMVFWSRARTPDQVWPTLTFQSLLERLGSELGLSTDAFEPREVRGDAELVMGPRPCVPPSSQTVRVEDTGSPAQAGDWVGQYVNGDRIFELLDREGFLRVQAGMDSEFEVKHFRDDKYFATIAGRPLWPFRLIRDDAGRRSAILGDRAHIHKEDRPGR